MFRRILICYHAWSDVAKLARLRLANWNTPSRPGTVSIINCVQLVAIVLRMEADVTANNPEAYVKNDPTLDVLAKQFDGIAS